MRALLLRELGVALRTRAFAVSAGTHAAVLAGWILTWGDATTGDDVYRAAILVQSLLLAVLLPWTAARCSAQEGGDDLVLLAALTAVPPSRVLAARIIATLVTLFAVVSAGLPVAIAAERMSSAPIAGWLGGQVAMMAIAIAACACVAVWRQQVRDRLAGWIAAEVSTVAVVVLAGTAAPSLYAAAAALALPGAATLLLLGVRSDRTLRYLSERHA